MSTERIVKKSIEAKELGEAKNEWIPSKRMERKEGKVGKSWIKQQGTEKSGRNLQRLPDDEKALEKRRR